MITSFRIRIFLVWTEFKKKNSDCSILYSVYVFFKDIQENAVTGMAYYNLLPVTYFAYLFLNTVRK